MRDDPILIVGGGLAGSSSALFLADAGYPVTLIEKRPFLGGRAFSFVEKGGAVIDNGQHALLGCYHETLGLLERVGVGDRLYRQKGIELEMREVGRRSMLTAGGMPAPFHLLRALGPFSMLTLRERVQAARGAIAFVLRARMRPEAVARETVEQALIRAGQSERVREVLWYPVALAALNDDPAVASATLFAEVVKRAFLGRAGDAAIVLPGVPLSDLFGAPVTAALAEAGVEVLTGATAKNILLRADGRVAGLTLNSGEERRGRGVILATTPGALGRLEIDDRPLTEVLGGIPESLEATAPIVSTHVSLPAPVDLPAVVGLIGTTTQWVFNSDRIRQDRTDGTGLLSCVTSGARELDGVPDAEVKAIVARELGELLPEVHGMSVEHMHVVRERHATMAPTPVAHAERPSVRTTVPGLFLCGDWVQTGLPATLESATMSGRMAAEAMVAEAPKAASGAAA
ncbi:MAG: hydroxysqualene dehydroxylase HpnE [Candidatus Binatia bacterium]|nr:hydroxysqualene dehydroxylase HpnE [Candidatus Binatia bacterium]MDG1960300.1 hydroxysqualene dehydroxylase HpnE [Candidatus Binatia bacterium]MDG2008424.1 hydroxysqualene dehydroxylase HpnE [Candidatus Binatia bacterium]